MRREGRPRAVRVHACAKINLALRVLGRRPDGYHTLRTIFQSIALHDTLTVVECGGPFAIECDDPGCPADRTNLVWRAAELAWRAAGRRRDLAGVRVRIDKRIPVAAGLGGGSSDAAAALRACARLWRVPRAQLLRLAASLGADVPFFLQGGTALGTGRGDLVRRLPDRPPSWVVLVVPSFGVSTREAYGWWDARAGSRAVGREGAGAPLNDLEVAVAAHHPSIARIVQALAGAGARAAAMSGSGSAVFGLFARRAAAVAAADALAAPSRRVVLTRTLDRRAHRSLVALELLRARH
jgi:4-diphosphocytidyl-2-C-methyl-D-erythritol kinase